MPATKANKTLEIAQVEVSYSNMETKTTDRLTSSVSVNFDSSEEVVKRKTNTKVMAECVLQIANDQNKLATALRDKGDVEGAKRVLNANGIYLERNAHAYGSTQLQSRSKSNFSAASALGGADWAKTRKGMRQDQHMDASQQKSGR